MDALKGLKVLELGQVVAAPFCGALLADFGADVTKVEPLEGDGIRYMGPVVDGRSLWYAVENRNKRTISVDLKQAEGQAIVEKLIRKSDVMTENFRPGVLSKLGFSWERISGLNPRIILARMSGYGQTGPYKNRAGYDRIGVGMGGLAYITGFKDREPLKPGVSISDYLTGFSAALGIMFAVYERDVQGSQQGQEIDVGLYEPIFRVSEFTAINYHFTKTVRQRIGNLFPATVPGGHFETKDGKWVCICVGNDKLFNNLMTLMGREDILKRPEYKTHGQRQNNREEIDEVTAAWVKEHTEKEFFDILGDHVPVGPIHDIAGIFEDPHYKARGNIVEVDDENWGKVKMQGVTPTLSRTPGKVKRIGQELGCDTWNVLKELDYSNAAISELETKGIVKGSKPFAEHLAKYGG